MQLADYLRRGRVLLLGQELARGTWRASLAWQLGGHPLEALIDCDKRTWINDVEIVHRSTAYPVLESDASLVDYDLIICGGTAPELTSADLGYSMRELVEKLDALHQKTRSGLAEGPIPYVLLVSTDGETLAATSLDEWHALEHVVVVIRDSSLALPLSFSRLALRALERSVAGILGLAFPDGHQRLRMWLNQFSDKERPVLLRLLRYFRYYAAEHLRHLAGEFLVSQTPKRGIPSGRVPVLDVGSAVPENIWLTYLGWPNKSAPMILPIVAKSRWMAALEERPLAKSYEETIRDFLPALVGLDEGDELHILTVDDVLGSGGQLHSYLDRFVNLDLRRAAYKFAGEQYQEKTWRNVARAFGYGGVRPKVYLHALFLIGIENSHIEKLCEEGLALDELAEVALARTGARPRRGTVTIQLEVDAEERHPIAVNLRIADYSRSLWSLVEGGLVDEAAIRALLNGNNRFYITKPRTKEHPLQFEPFGWKDTGGLVSTFINCPGNTLPILWGDRDDLERVWSPLYRRYFNVWSDGAEDFDTLASRLCDAVEVRDLSALQSSPKHKREAVGYVLAIRASDAEKRVAELLGLEREGLPEWQAKIHARLATDPAYREEMRALFRETC